VPYALVIGGKEAEAKSWRCVRGPRRRGRHACRRLHRETPHRSRHPRPAGKEGSGKRKAVSRIDANCGEASLPFDHAQGLELVETLAIPRLTSDRRSSRPPSLGEGGSCGPFPSLSSLLADRLLDDHFLFRHRHRHRRHRCCGPAPPPPPPPPPPLLCFHHRRTSTASAAMAASASTTVTAAAATAAAAWARIMGLKEARPNGPNSMEAGVITAPVGPPECDGGAPCLSSFPGPPRSSGDEYIAHRQIDILIRQVLSVE